MCLVLVKVEHPVDLCPFDSRKRLVVLFITIFVSLLDPVRNCLPILRADDCQRHLGLEVRLVETREHSETVESFKLRVQILLLVFCVGECVQSDAILVVRVHISELDCVPPLDHIRHGQAYLLSLKLTVLAFSVVDGQIGHGQSLQVDKQFSVICGGLGQVKVYHRVAQVVVSLLQRKLIVIFDLFNETFASVCLSF